MQPIPNRSHNPADHKSQDGGDYDQCDGEDGLERSDCVQRLNEMQLEDPIDKPLRNSESHQQGPRQMPQSEKRTKHESKESRATSSPRSGPLATGARKWPGKS